MRTNALLLAAALVAGGAITGAAQTVYSINAVGYVNVTIPVGYTMLANPLSTTNNTIASLMPTPAEDTVIFKWTGTTFVGTTFSFGEWDNPTITLNPGEGCFIRATTQFTNTFVGEVMQGSLTNDIPVGYSMRASMVPQEGTAPELGLTVPEDSIVFKYINNGQGGGGFDGYSYSFGEWDKVPTFKVGESFWVQAPAAGSWVRNFNINQ